MEKEKWKKNREGKEKDKENGGGKGGEREWRGKGEREILEREG